MDIIATGVSFSSNARIKVICDFIKKVQVSITNIFVVLCSTVALTNYFALIRTIGGLP